MLESSDRIQRGMMIVVSGPAGSGKGTVLSHLYEDPFGKIIKLSLFDKYVPDFVVYIVSPSFFNPRAHRMRFVFCELLFFSLYNVEVKAKSFIIIFDKKW